MSVKLTFVIFAVYCVAVAFAPPPGKHVLQKITGVHQNLYTILCTLLHEKDY